MYKLYEFETEQPDNQKDRRLLYISPFTTNKSISGRPHSHKCTEIFFCLKGSCNFYIRDISMRVKELDFLIIHPAVEHMERNTTDTFLEYIVIGVSNTYFSFENTSNGYYKGNIQGNESLLIPVLRAIVEQSENKDDGYINLCEKLLDVLLEYINKISNMTLYSDMSLSNIKSSDNNILWVKQYIDDNFTKQINLDILASKIGLNKYSLVRNFKRVFNISPIHYMISLRFKQSKFLLRTTNDSVKQIAEALGFSSANYFSQCFLTKEGMTPTEYRQRHLNSGD